MDRGALKYLYKYCLKKDETEAPEIAGERPTPPSSFVGGPRYMLPSYRDALPIAADFTKPELFLSRTT